MANFPKALAHHKKAGASLKQGDSGNAAHHLGHALAALRQNAGADDGDGPDAESTYDQIADTANDPRGTGFAASDTPSEPTNGSNGTNGGSPWSSPAHPKSGGTLRKRLASFKKT